MKQKAAIEHFRWAGAKPGLAWRQNETANCGAAFADTWNDLHGNEVVFMFSHSHCREDPSLNPAHVQNLKRAVSRHAPSLFRLIRNGRLSLHQSLNRRFQAELTPWKGSFIARYGFEVQHGPFAGMKCHESSAEQTYLPLLIGSYEAETHGFIDQALARDPRMILDIGCEAGYVAVGLALRQSSARLIGFDIDETARAKCRALAKKNGVEDRLSVEGACDLARLNTLCAAQHTLVFCDCEGCELDLLDPEAAPNLKMADMIVELHDFMRFDIDITPTLVSRFRDTHDIAIASVARRKVEDYPCLDLFPRTIRARAIHEDRVSYQQWAYFKARAFR
jgi:hypothetical protein